MRIFSIPASSLQAALEFFCRHRDLTFLKINLSCLFHNFIKRRNLIDRKSTRLNSSHRTISYAVFCLKKNNISSLSFNTNSTTKIYTLSLHDALPICKNAGNGASLIHNENFFNSSVFSTSGAGIFLSSQGSHISKD